MRTLAGTTIEYAYAGADSYRLDIGDGSVHWTALTGQNAGENRTEQADIVEIAQDVWFISWLEPTQELVSLCINLAKRRIYASYYCEGERFFWKGSVTHVSVPDALK